MPLPNIDLSQLSLDELNDLIDAVSAAREKAIQKRREELIAELNELGGLPINPRKARPYKALFSYVHGDRKWSGLGPRPKWIKEFVESGGDLESIKKKNS